MPPKTLNISQVAEYIGVTTRTLYNMLRDGRFTLAPIPGTNPRRWSADAIQAWVDGGEE